VSRDRHQSRTIAAQTLCHDDVQQQGVGFALEKLEAEFDAKDGTIRYAREICEHYKLAKDQVDGLITSSMPNWTLKRLSASTRSVLRVATVELLCKNVPPKVVIDEAIDIAREFETDDAGKFVNGVLDAVFRKISEES
jgi:transcription antitermination protein NusB